VVSAFGGEEEGSEERGQWGDRGATASQPTAAATVSEASGSEASVREASGREAPADALPWEGKMGSKRVHIQVLSLLAFLVQSTKLTPKALRADEFKGCERNESCGCGCWCGCEY